MGWYQDAGDWDGYLSHLRVPQELMLAYEMGRSKFSDGELNIPESGNGMPDILDEAAGCRVIFSVCAPSCCEKMGHGRRGRSRDRRCLRPDEKTLPDGSKVGQGSWEDVNRVYMVSGEDPWSTYLYAGTAAHLADLIRQAAVKRDPQGSIGAGKRARPMRGLRKIRVPKMKAKTS
jgi:hypothetical protein